MMRARGWWLVAGAWWLVSCGGGDLETRTYDLQRLRPDEARALIAPYVFSERADMSVTERGITVRERPEAHGRIAALLERYDAPRQDVLLRFQLVEADGFTGADAAIADVEQELRRLFRFDGYRLVGELVVQATEGASIDQTIVTEDRRYQLLGHVGHVSAGSPPAAAVLEVRLAASGFGDIFQTSVNLRDGQTVVLGTAKPDAERGALILTVRPEIGR